MFVLQCDDVFEPSFCLAPSEPESSHMLNVFCKGGQHGVKHKLSGISHKITADEIHAFCISAQYLEVAYGKSRPDRNFLLSLRRFKDLIAETLLQ